MKLFKQGIAHIFYGNDIVATITYILLPIMISYLIILIDKAGLNCPQNLFFSNRKQDMKETIYLTRDESNIIKGFLSC